MEKMRNGTPDPECVVLVDKTNHVLGTAPKLETHGEKTPLHRGFSLFIFNSKGELLLQQRSRLKKTWPLVWSNSCCGHPMLKEENTAAAKRRTKFELGIELNKVYEILPDFSYKETKDGIMENEICPVLVAFLDKEPLINSSEVENTKWVNWQDFLKEIREKPGTYSVWCEQEAKLLSQNKEFLKLYKEFTN